VPDVRRECNDPQGRLRLLHCVWRNRGVWLKQKRLIASNVISRSNALLLART
jgi:hypothetical protein